MKTYLKIVFRSYLKTIFTKANLSKCALGNVLILFLIETKIESNLIEPNK